MLNVTKKLKLFVLYTEITSMIWLRLFIALIALTTSSALSAWAAPLQVNSPEGFYDCAGIANGTTVRTDCGCGQPASSTYACLRCGDNISCLDCRGVPFGTTPKTDCGCGAPASSSYACRRCGDTTSCLDCRGVPFGTTPNTNCGCGQPAAGACGCNLSIVNRGCGCGKPAPGACGCNLSITCCQNAFPPNIAPGIKCAAFRGWGGCKNCGGTNKGFYSNGWNGYVDTKYGSCVGSSGSGQFLCGSMRCYSGACPPDNIGCFDPGTQILLEGGKLVPASDIRVGDRLYNPLSGRSFAVKRILVGPEEIPMVELGFDGHLLKVTQDHPVLTRDGMKRANTVRIGEVIVDASGNEKVLHYVRLAEIIPGQKALNFELDVDSQDPIDRLIVSDNITSGDLAVQNSELQGED